MAKPSPAQIAAEYRKAKQAEKARKYMAAVVIKAAVREVLNGGR